MFSLKDKETSRNKAQTESPKPDNSTLSDINCSNCGRSGHFFLDCDAGWMDEKLAAQATEATKYDYCEFCGVRGHLRDFCPRNSPRYIPNAMLCSDKPVPPKPNTYIKPVKRSFQIPKSDSRKDSFVRTPRPVNRRLRNYSNEFEQRYRFGMLHPGQMFPSTGVGSNNIIRNQNQRQNLVPNQAQAQNTILSQTQKNFSPNVAFQHWPRPLLPPEHSLLRRANNLHFNNTFYNPGSPNVLHPNAAIRPVPQMQPLLDPNFTSRPSFRPGQNINPMHSPNSMHSINRIHSPNPMLSRNPMHFNQTGQSRFKSFNSPGQNSNFKRAERGLELGKSFRVGDQSVYYNGVVNERSKTFDPRSLNIKRNENYSLNADLKLSQFNYSGQQFEIGSRNPRSIGNDF